MLSGVLVFFGQVFGERFCCHPGVCLSSLFEEERGGALGGGNAETPRRQRASVMS
jgi:hypothetical protein